MKKFVSIITLMVMLICAIPMCSDAYNVGDVIGEAVHTDIVATINGYQIPSYNVNGYTYIVAEELRNYGFTVGYCDADREISVQLVPDIEYVPKEYEKPYVDASRIGQHAYSILYTDIRAYIDWEPAQSFNIDGYTIIRFDDLNRFGVVSYDDSKREISLDVEGHSRNPHEAIRIKSEVLTTMTSEEKSDVNLFLSNFSEQHYGFAGPYKSPEEEKLNFAITHIRINTPDVLVELPEGGYGIKAEEIDKILYKFFGSTVAHPVEDSLWKYEDGMYKYTAVAWDSDFYAMFSIATSMFAMSDGTYTVEFNIYAEPQVEQGDTITDKSVYSLSPAKATEKYDYCGYGTAVVREKSYNGKKTYELVDYTVK